MSADTISDGEKWFTIVFLSIVIVVTIIGNVIALHAFIVSPELKKITYYFIATLCISDLMIAMFSMPFWVWITADMSAYETVPKGFQIFINIIDIFCATWSITSLAMISIERYICISYALHYYYIITNRRVVYMLVFTMFYTSTTAILNQVQGPQNNSARFKAYQSVIVLLAYVLPVMVKLFTYSRIFKEAKRQFKQINQYNFTLGKKEDIIDADTHSIADSLDGQRSSLIEFSFRNSAKRNSRMSQPDSPTIKGKFSKSSMNDSHQYDEKQERNIILSSDKDIDSLKYRLRRFVKGTTSCINYGDDTGTLSHDENQNTDVLKQKLSTENDSLIKEDGFILQRNETDLSMNNKPNSKDDRTMIVVIDGKSTKTKLTKKQSKVKNVEKKCLSLCHDGINNDSSDSDSITQDKASITPQEKHNKMRHSLDVIEGKIQNISNSPLLRRLRGSSSSPAPSPSLFRKHLNKHKRQEQRVRRFKKELRATKVVGFIIGAFIVCWTPFTVLMFMLICDADVPQRAVFYAKNLHYLNSAINPILYVVLNKVYRVAVLKTLRRIKNKLPCL